MDAESVLEENTKILNSKTLHLEEKNKLIEEMEYEMQLLQNALHSIKVCIWFMLKISSLPNTLYTKVCHFDTKPPTSTILLHMDTRFGIIWQCWYGAVCHTGMIQYVLYHMGQYGKPCSVYYLMLENVNIVSYMFLFNELQIWFSVFSDYTYNKLSQIIFFIWNS